MPVDQHLADEVIAAFHKAAGANRRTPNRRGSLIDLPMEAGSVFISADLHGNRVNFERVLKSADLDRHPTRHLIMQEVCHGGPSYPHEGGCMSHLMLEDVARLKVKYPDRFHFILSNHELAEALDFAVVKAGRLLNVHFRSGFHSMYGAAVTDVQDASIDFIRSCPIGVKIAGYALVTHSLPAKLDTVPFDATILQRDLEPIDYDQDGAAFRLVWGRDFRLRNAEIFTELAGVKFLIHGHEPCAQGFLVPNDLQIIIDGCGVNARTLILPLDREITHADAVGRIERLHP